VDRVISSDSGESIRCSRSNRLPIDQYVFNVVALVGSYGKLLIISMIYGDIARRIYTTSSSRRRGNCVGLQSEVGHERSVCSRHERVSVVRAHLHPILCPVYEFIAFVCSGHKVYSISVVVAPGSSYCSTGRRISRCGYRVLLYCKSRCYCLI
jgi:hypothetical protein